MKTISLAYAHRGWVPGICVAAVLLLGAGMAAWGQETGEAGMQVLTRGPVHEAFAKASMTGATAGLIVSKAPPDPIAEIPPDQRPEGGNVAWIPGYWSWDDERTDFIWVSGVWRDLPPGRQWVPGYWTADRAGWQWISGFWADAAQTEVSYLPPPPEPLEAGPSSPAPGSDYLWSPGNWVWQDSGYAWQAGYWVPQRPDWIWVPAHYTWTPRGSVYVPGYWDHDITHRGMMFAPVYYERPLYGQPGYAYSPSVVIDLGAVAACLFVQPRSHDYYFGDYYDHRYEERGFYPWYSKELRRYGDDPVYAQYRTEQLRRDPEWDNHVQEQFSYRREHVDARPPQTLALQLNLFNTRKADMPEHMFIGKSLAEAALSKTMPLHLAPVNVEERRLFETSGQEVRKFQLNRAKLEIEAATAEKPKEGRGEARPASTLKLPVSPVAAKPLGKAMGAIAPPPVPVAPKPQAMEPGTRGEAPRKMEAIVSPSQPLQLPAIKDSRSAAITEEPKKIAPRPNRIGSAPETIRPESAPTKAAPRIETEHVEAKPEAKPEMRQLQRGREITEPTRETVRRPETPRLELSAPKTESKMEAPRNTMVTPEKNRQTAPGNKSNKEREKEK